MTKSRADIGIKSIALLLIIGGAAGVVGGLWGDVQMLAQSGFRPSANSSIVAVFILIFGWSTWVGFSLWNRKPAGYKWAKVLFAAQIPIISLPDFSFSGFHTGLGFTVILSFHPTQLHFGFQLLSSIGFLISPEVEAVLVGVNLVGILAFTYLIRATSANDRQRSNFGLI